MESEREKRWRDMLAIGERNADKDPNEVEREVAEEIEATRRERRVAVRNGAPSSRLRWCTPTPHLRASVQQCSNPLREATVAVFDLEPGVPHTLR